MWKDGPWHHCSNPWIQLYQKEELTLNPLVCEENDPPHPFFLYASLSCFGHMQLIILPKYPVNITWETEDLEPTLK